MNRQEAIEHIWVLSRQVAGEFNASSEEDRQSEEETRDALLALGCTFDESQP